MKAAGTSMHWRLCECLRADQSLFSLLSAVTSISGKAGVKSSIKPPPPPDTLILDVHTFNDVALVSNKTAHGPNVNCCCRTQRRMFWFHLLYASAPIVPLRRLLINILGAVVRPLQDPEAYI
jgi:hypothetical protein